MTTNWQQGILKTIDEAFNGNQGVFLDAGTDPFSELRQLTAKQASTDLPGAGNSVANQVRHLITSITMHQPQFMGGEFPNLDWSADWSQQQLTDAEWQQLLNELEALQGNLKGWIAEPAIEQDQEYATACIMAATHLAFHIGQIQHAAAYAKQA